MMNPAVSITSLSHVYNGKSQLHALDGITLDIAPGQFTAVIGPSGCGKSTLLRLLAGLIKPTAGEIYINGMVPAQAAAAHHLVWMAQKPALLPWLTVEGNLQLARRMQAGGKLRNYSNTDILTMVGLSESAEQYPHQLSGGMQQRLALARLMVVDAPLWLMDEPFAALDELTRDSITSEFAALWRLSKPAVLWVTHNIHEAIRLADRILVMSARPGRIISDLSIDLTQPRTESSCEFQNLLTDIRLILSPQYIGEPT